MSCSFRMVALVGAAVCLAACVEIGPERDDTVESDEPIVKGADDSKSTFAVALCRFDAVSAGATSRAQCEPTCSGTLIAPNLVLTARHCIADIERAESGFYFGPSVPADRLAISTEAKPGKKASAWRPVVAVYTPQDVTHPYNDIALVQLRDNVPANVAKPALPAMKNPFRHPRCSPQTGSPVSQVVQIGYGYNKATWEYSEVTGQDVIDYDGIGKRRIVKKVPVLCAGGERTLPSCTPCPVKADRADTCNVFVGSLLTGSVNGSDTCPGDSGGGAYEQASFDAKKPRVLGVVSTGTAEDCTGGTIYVRTDHFATFLATKARLAAQQGGYRVPAWVDETTGDGADGGAPGGCDGGAPEPPPASCTYCYERWAKPPHECTRNPSAPSTCNNKSVVSRNCPDTSGWGDSWIDDLCMIEVKGPPPREECSWNVEQSWEQNYRYGTAPADDCFWTFRSTNMNTCSDRPTLKRILVTINASGGEYGNAFPGPLHKKYYLEDRNLQPPSQCKCPVDSDPTAEGRCLCPAGTSWDGYECRP
jgi:hypothetical protein